MGTAIFALEKCRSRIQLIIHANRIRVKHLDFNDREAWFVNKNAQAVWPAHFVG